ncbi:MAG: hypothetical protein NUW37_07305 [Planctomycetes bacterium]|nr:hypothetical protein [Planctomycetota bacterium]
MRCRFTRHIGICSVLFAGISLCFAAAAPREAHGHGEFKFPGFPVAVTDLSIDEPDGGGYTFRWTPPDEGAESFEFSYFSAQFNRYTRPDEAASVGESRWTIFDSVEAKPGEDGKIAFALEFPDIDAEIEDDEDAIHHGGARFFESWFRVRAIDSSGNAGSWSAPVNELAMVQKTCFDSDANCHAVPPLTGEHRKHVSHLVKCFVCHSRSVDPYYVTNSEWHDNGEIDVDLADTDNQIFNGVGCQERCHNSKNWLGFPDYLRRMQNPNPPRIVIHPVPETPPAQEDDEDF